VWALSDPLHVDPLNINAEIDAKHIVHDTKAMAGHGAGASQNNRYNSRSNAHTFLSNTNTIRNRNGTTTIRVKLKAGPLLPPIKSTPHVWDHPNASCVEGGVLALKHKLMGVAEPAVEQPSDTNWTPATRGPPYLAGSKTVKKARRQSRSGRRFP
jgi:hypothetical protein